MNADVISMIDELNLIEGVTIVLDIRNHDRFGKLSMNQYKQVIEILMGYGAEKAYNNEELKHLTGDDYYQNLTLGSHPISLYVTKEKTKEEQLAELQKKMDKIKAEMDEVSGVKTNPTISEEDYDDLGLPF